MDAGTFSFNAFAMFQRFNPTTLAADQQRFAKRGDVQNEIAYFKSKIGSITTPEEFMKDFRLMKFALSAYSMESQMDYPARIKQILMSDPTDPKALVNRMSDESYRTINRAFDFINSGVTKLKSDSFVSSLVDNYVANQHEVSLSELNSTMTDGLYFERKIKGITSGYQIIGDPVLFAVVKSALNIPNAAVTGSVERLKDWVERDFDLKRTNDPKYIRDIVNRFLVLKDVQARLSEGNPLLDIFA
jgi:hypothetical protein